MWRLNAQGMEIQMGEPQPGRPRRLDLRPELRLHLLQPRPRQKRRDGFQNIPADQDIEEKVTRLHAKTPEEHRARRGIQEHIQCPHRFAEVHYDEKGTYTNRGHGQKLPEYGDSAELR